MRHDTTLQKQSNFGSSSSTAAAAAAQQQHPMWIGRETKQKETEKIIVIHTIDNDINAISFSSALPCTRSHN